MKDIPQIPALPSQHMYVAGLDKTSANHVAISPIAMLQRTALVYPQKLAIVHGDLRQTWEQTWSL